MTFDTLSRSCCAFAVLFAVGASPSLALGKEQKMGNRRAPRGGELGAVTRAIGRCCYEYGKRRELARQPVALMGMARKLMRADYDNRFKSAYKRGRKGGGASAASTLLDTGIWLGLSKVTVGLSPPLLKLVGLNTALDLSARGLRRHYAGCQAVVGEALRVAVSEPDRTTTAVRRILDNDPGVLARLQRDLQRRGSLANADQRDTLELVSRYTASR